MPTKSLEASKSLIGTSNPTVEAFEIEAGKVAEFARAITDPTPVFYDERAANACGHDRIPAPLTFTRVGRFPRYRPDDLDGYGFDLGFQPEYVLHGEQAYEYDRSVRVGDVLSGTTTLTGLYQREGGRGGTMTFAVFETVYTDQHGERVLTERATSIETTGAVVDHGRAAPKPTEQLSTPRTVRPRELPTDRVDTPTESDTARIEVETVDRRDFVRYAGASGDFNPIHYDEPYARNAGNECVFGQGMFTAGITSRLLTDWFGVDRIASFGVRFQSRVLPGDTISVTGEISDTDETTVDLEAAADEKTLLTGTATVLTE